MGIEKVGRPSQTVGAVLSGVLGISLLLAAALGPLLAERIRFHLSSDALAQYVGGEIVTVLVGLVFVASVPGWWAGWAWVPAVAAGACGYVVYTFATVVAGQEYTRYPGNVENAFLLYAAITAAAVALLVTAFRALVTVGGPAGPRRPTGWVLIGIGVVVGLLWLGQVASFYRTGPSEEYESATTLFWLIKYLDLGLVIPLAVFTGVLQWSPSRATDAAAMTMLGFMTLLLMALTLMAVEMLRRDTAGASWAVAIGAALLLVPPAVLWSRWLMPTEAEPHGCDRSPPG
jgi:hypothetical protein